MKMKGKGFSQLWKRNAVVAAIALFVCAAVYLNWSYEQEAGKTLGESTMVGGEDPLLEGTTGGSSSTVTLGRGSGSQEVVPLQTLAPQFQGALVVCPGGEDPEVCLQIIQAVSALTGLGSDRISVCPSQS